MSEVSTKVVDTERGRAADWALAPGDSLDVAVEMIGDWHIGTGGGRHATVDRTVLRDYDNLPYLPASSLIGVWRDAAEQLAIGLDDGTDGAWTELVESLFGSQSNKVSTPDGEAPRPRRFTLDPARLTDSQRAILAHPLINPAVTVIRPGVAIDPETGTAKADHLRMIEMARAGAVLHSRLTALDDLPGEAVALLVAATSLTTRVGGKRRRGAGRCTLRLSSPNGSLDVAVAAEIIEATDSPTLHDAVLRNTAPIDSQVNQAPRDAVASAGSPMKWRSATITVEAIGPIILGGRVTGQVQRSADQLPGAVLLPILQRVASHPLAPVLATGELLVGAGRLADAQGEAMLPAPRSLAVSKDEPRWQLRNLFDPDPGPVRRLAARAVVTLDESSRLVVRHPAFQLRVHNEVDGARQRPRADAGGLFVREAHAPGTRWVATIRYRGDAVDIVEDALDKLAGTCRIGRAKHGDYGLAALAVNRSAGEESSDQNEPHPAVGSAAGVTGGIGSFDVLLVTDALLLGPSLRPDPTPQRFVEALATALAGQSPATRLTLEAAYGAQHRIESWQQKWGLPRPTLVGLAAGTVLRITADPAVDRRRLAEVGQLGIGERIGEGYGCFVVDPPELHAGELANDAQPADTPIPSLEVDTDDPYVGHIATAALIESARVRAESGAWDLGTELITTGLTNSQIGALRSVFGQADNWQVGLNAWLDGVEHTESRRRKWPDETRKQLRKLARDPKLVFDDGFDDWPDDVKREAAGRAVPVVFGEILRRVETGGTR